MDTQSLVQKQALQASLNGQWQKAIELNLQLIEDNPNNASALNCLARAYSELGDLKKARSYYTKVLEIDSYNSIAQKSLKRLSAIKAGSVNKSVDRAPIVISASTFLQEPGVTKIVNLIKV